MWDGVEANMRTKEHERKADNLQAKDTCMLMHVIAVSE